MTSNGPMPGIQTDRCRHTVRTPGFRIAGSSVTVVGSENDVVVMLPWLGLMTKPDGFTVMVPVPLV